jgi:hypothetical protein
MRQIVKAYGRVIFCTLVEYAFLWYNNSVYSFILLKLVHFYMKLAVGTCPARRFPPSVAML